MMKAIVVRQRVRNQELAQRTQTSKIQLVPYIARDTPGTGNPQEGHQPTISQQTSRIEDGPRAACADGPFTATTVHRRSIVTVRSHCVDPDIV